jgi:hypothetical protein
MGTVGLGACLAAVFAGGVEHGDAFCHARQLSFSPRYCVLADHGRVGVVLGDKYTEGYPVQRQCQTDFDQMDHGIVPRAVRVCFVDGPGEIIGPIEELNKHFYPRSESGLRNIS